MPARRVMAALGSIALLSLAGCAGDDLSDPAGDPDRSAAGGGPVRISGQSFPEAVLVTAMYDEVLTRAGYDTSIKLVDTRDVYMKEFPDEIDVVPEYVGGIVDFLNTTENGPDAEPLTSSDASESIANAADLLQDRGITLLEPAAATDTNAFFVTEEFSNTEGVTKLSDLEGRPVTLAAAPDCEGRPDCEGGLTEVYGIDVREVLPLGFASDQTYQSVLDGESDLGLTSTTDGTLESQGLVLLEDDRAIQPAQNLVPAVSSSFLSEYPDVETILEELMGALTTESSPSSTAGCRLTARSPRTWPTTSWWRKGWSASDLPPGGDGAGAVVHGAGKGSRPSEVGFVTHADGSVPP